jgi:hypothetical protein
LEGDLRYGVRVDGSWTIEDVAPIYGSDSLAFALDADGGRHVVFANWEDPGSGWLEYGYRASSDERWTFSSPGSSFPSDGLAIAIDRSGRPRIGYADRWGSVGEGEAELRYVHRAADGALQDDLVDAVGHTGFYTALAIDRRGGVHMAYGRFGDVPALMYAYHCPG